MSDDYNDTSDGFSDVAWVWSQTARDKRQEHAIRELAEQQRRAARNADRRQRDERKELEGRIDESSSRLSSRIDVVLRWTELRFQQVEFDEYQARREIRNTVRALAAGRQPLARGFEDVPGYWLPSAAAAVLPLVLRDRVPAQRTAGNAFADLKSGLEHARERDAVRTELFSLAVGRCFDQPAFIDAAVLRLLSEPADLGVVEPGQVARGWRTLWEQAAQGAFGPGAESQIAALLRERFDPAAIDEEALATWEEAIEGFGATRAEAIAALEAHLTAKPRAEDRGGEDATADPQSDATAPEAPAAALSGSLGSTAESGALRLGVPVPSSEAPNAPSGSLENDALLGSTAESGAPRLGGSAPGSESPAAPSGSFGNDALLGTTAETGAPRLGVSTPISEAPAAETREPLRDDTAWRSYLQELIEEPSAAELPLVRQMAELDPTPQGREGDSRSWSAPAGTLAELIRRDLFDPETPIPLRRIALGLATPILRSRLDRAEASIGTTEKVTVSVRRRGEYIAVTRDGHDPEQFEAVERRIDEAFHAAEPSKPLAVAIAAALGALSVLTLVFGQWFLAVLFALAVLIPIWKFRSDAAKARKHYHRRDEQLAEVRAALVRARKDAERQEREDTERGLATRRAIKRLRESLPAETAPSALGEPGPGILGGPA